MTKKEILALLDPLTRRVRLAVSRAVVRLTDDASKRQMLQVEVLKDEVKDRVEHMQNYGFTSVALAGAQALMVSISSNRDHPVVTVVDDPRHRLTGLSPGEVAIYTDEGDTIILKRGRTIEIETVNLVVKADEKVRFETPEFEVTGDITDRCDDADRYNMRGMRTIYNTHTHNENNSSGPTDEPNEKMGA